MPTPCCVVNYNNSRANRAPHGRDGARRSLPPFSWLADSCYFRPVWQEGGRSASIITKRGDDDLRTLLVQLTARVGWQKAVVALANKNARILWAVLAKGRRIDPNHVSAKPQGPASVVPTLAG